jgi:hypothetical protein
LNPSVRAIINLRNRGAGIPDGLLFTADQLRRREEGTDPGSGGAAGFPTQLPARGAVEVKGLLDDVGEIVRTEQVGRYLTRYGQVLVTNYREFVLVGRDRVGQPVEMLSGIFPEEISLPDLIANHLDRQTEPAEPGDRHRVVVAPGGPPFNAAPSDKRPRLTFQVTLAEGSREVELSLS